ncbi:flagella biosynthesis chaperone FliJ [Photobacterium sp. CCB-ST2H9]|uniref:flagellar export protein FliJ n=1 Tax=Photobacterium sp. CCB-ST2H9 TaxID=2912855 RepID=UPI0020042E53|nr:flagellar export protein FliJ [Photobacterium sp. CCB-ST2H9]UTM58092.1 flagella biosynthesis chaperone FliJ [Photobacterium sp. CCB-ST2H9]
MSERALVLILEQAKEKEHNAFLALEQAKRDLDSFYLQREQIEKYRFDYCRQLTERGQNGLTASQFSHLHKFLGQLDETLAQQAAAGREFERQVEQCAEIWQETRKDKKSVEWLLEKKEAERELRLARQEQKLMDEFATLQSARRAR